jgi:hypothetical protein
MMGDSNGSWGELAEYDSALASAWDSYSPLPESGVNAALDSLCERKHITIESLIKQGARLSDESTLAFAYGKGVKFRDLVTGRRWSTFGSEFDTLKIVRHGATPTGQIVVAEGETDGARLSLAYNVDVAIMPSGARYFPETYAEQLRTYDVVLVGLDNDEAGKDGTDKALTYLANAMPFHPPGTAKDWCEAEEFPELPTEVHRDTSAIIVPAGKLIELPEPDTVSWYEQAVLPVSGLAIIHGWAKSFKTFLALDLLSALTQAEPWACLEPTEEPCKTLAIQYEIPWAFYRQRVLQLRSAASNVGLFDENFNTWDPLSRPKLVAGNKKQEDYVLQSCIDAGISVVLLDPIRRATGAIDMNDEKDVRAMLMFFERLNGEGITVVATHHDSKSAARARGGDPLDMTGSGAWAGDPDTLISIELPRGENHRTSVKRNVNFTLRNAPAIGGRAFEMHEDGIAYHMEPWEPAEIADPTAPAI